MKNKIKIVNHKIRYYNWLLDNQILKVGSVAYHLTIRLLKNYKIKYYCLTH